MSRTSFPRPEHSDLLRARITAQLQAHGIPLEIGGCRLDQLRCCYCFSLRRAPHHGWIEFPVHFQIAERLMASGGDAELGRILSSFLQRTLPSAPQDSSQDSG